MGERPLQGKVAIVTGAGSTIGLGRAMTLALVQAGARVAMLDVDQAALDQSAADVRKVGGPDSVLPILADVTRPEDAEGAVQLTISDLGGLHILVNNAGINVRNQTHDAQLQAMRLAVRDARRVATIVGFGPRFLHSTGQAYKGGPNSGVFLQITCDDAADLPVPGRRYSFGVVKAAQARGDFQVLAERGRRALRVHLHGDLEASLTKLRTAISEALR